MPAMTVARPTCLFLATALCLLLLQGPVDAKSSKRKFDGDFEFAEEVSLSTLFISLYSDLCVWLWEDFFTFARAVGFLELRVAHKDFQVTRHFFRPLYTYSHQGADSAVSLRLFCVNFFSSFSTYI